MAKVRIYNAAEFKRRTITGPMIDEIVGRAVRECGVKDQELTDVYVFCLNANAGARKRAAELEQVHNIRIAFRIGEAP